MALFLNLAAGKPCAGFLLFLKYSICAEGYSYANAYSNTNSFADPFANPFTHTYTYTCLSASCATLSGTGCSGRR